MPFKSHAHKRSEDIDQDQPEDEPEAPRSHVGGSTSDDFAEWFANTEEPVGHREVQGERTVSLIDPADSVRTDSPGSRLAEGQDLAGLPDNAMEADPETGETDTTIQSEPGVGNLAPSEPAAPGVTNSKTRALSVRSTDLSHHTLAMELGKHGFDQEAKYVSAWGGWVIWDGLSWK